jgi:DNA-binding response OmpR family regulator
MMDAGAAHAAHAAHVPAGQQWVLLVEDDPQVRLAIRWTLEAEGIVVEAAATGRHALALAADRRPTLVLLDFGLPDLSGDAVADGLKAAYGDVPILLLTADGRAAERAARAEAFAYLRTPFEMDELVGVVKRALEVR